jgi:hypothetical protein
MSALLSRLHDESAIAERMPEVLDPSQRSRDHYFVCRPGQAPVPVSRDGADAECCIIRGASAFSKLVDGNTMATQGIC